MKLERVTGGACGHPFPVYENLGASLLAAHGTVGIGRNATVAHVLRTCGGHAYANVGTVAMMMARLGERSRTREVRQSSRVVADGQPCLRASRVICFMSRQPASAPAWRVSGSSRNRRV